MGTDFSESRGSERERERERSRKTTPHHMIFFCGTHSSADPATGLWDRLRAYMHPSSLLMHLYTVPKVPEPTSHTS